MLWIVATFYKFVRLDDCAILQPVILESCQHHGVKGTILLATEGINGTIAGTRAAIDAVVAHLQQDSRLANLSYKESTTQIAPFERLKVRLKQEIVTLGLPEVNPTEQVGTYVEPQDWNQLISDPDILVIDTRNDYEVEMGSFQGAENPQTQSFREFPDYVQRALDPQKHRKVAMFCTGGIRCEKASAYLLRQGFETVYHLKGGILKYLETVPSEQSLWEGECFVFDERVALGHQLEIGSYDLCYACGYPISAAGQASPTYEAGISCPRCWPTLTPEKRAQLRDKLKQRQLRSKRHPQAG